MMREKAGDDAHHPAMLMGTRAGRGEILPRCAGAGAE
jgi:hypothetical protein